MAQPTTYGQLDKAASSATQAAKQRHAEDRLSVRASLLVWLVLSIASWGVLFGLYRILFG